MKRASLRRSLPAWVFIALCTVPLGAGLAYLITHRSRPIATAPVQVAAPPPDSAGATMADVPEPTPPRRVPTVPPDGPGRSGILGRAEILDEHWLEDPASTPRPRRVRLARLPDDGRLVRLLEQHQADPAGRLVVLSTAVMRADAVLVAVPAGSTAPAVAERLRAAGFEPEPAQAPDAVVGVRVGDLSLDGVPATLASLARALPDLVAEPDYLRFRSQVRPNDYEVTRLWGLEQIEAPAAWTVSTGASNVVVAVIDSGITTTHPDLSANLWVNDAETPGNSRDDDGNGYIDDIHGWNFGSNNASLQDTDGHGTHVAGTIGAAGNDGSGIVGVNWNVRIMALRAGSDTFTDSALLNALRYALAMRQRGVRVVAVNMSLGGVGESLIFRQELVRARDAGLLVVAAAGNLDDDLPTADNDLVPVYPASYDVDCVIAVAASNQADSLSVFSHYGATGVDLAAPGTAIYSTVTAGGYARYNGTSMAAPHVSGAIALVAAAHPSLTGAQLRARILESADPVPALAGKVATGGRLNLRRAVDPGLLRPRVAITQGGAPVEIAVLDRPGLSLDLEAVLQPEGGKLPAADLTWTMEEGPSPALISSPQAGDTTVTFPVAGRYRIRVTATAGALQEIDEIQVAVATDTSPTSAGLEAWWRLDDGGSIAADASGNARQGSVVGALPTSTAVLGSAYEFNGATSRIGFSAPGRTRITISGWARASGVNPATIFPRVVHMREGLLFGGFDRSGVDDGNADTLKFALDDGVSDQVWHTPPGSFVVGSWFHVAVTFDPAAAVPAPVFYINGQRQVTGTQGSAASAPSVAAGVGYLGDRGDGSRGWLGQLDEIRLYGRALDGTEIAWLSREATLRALADGVFAVGATTDPYVVPLSFTPAAAALGTPDFVSATWTDLGGGATFTGATSAGATARFLAPGTRLVRFDATTADGVHLTRTATVDVPASAIIREGYFSGSTSFGGTWTLLVRSDGTGTFFSASSRGSFQRDFAVETWGVFSFQDRSGSVVIGRIWPDGSVTGYFEDPDGAVSTFSGGRASVSFGASDPARDGVYSGWVVDTGIRAAAQVERGTISIVVEERGEQRVATGAIDGSGAFALTPAAGVSFRGSAAGDRLQADFLVPGSLERRVVLLRDGAATSRRLSNISVRGFVGTGEAVLIPGFVIDRGVLPVLVRGVGPGLTPLGVVGALEQTHITLRQGAQVLRENAGWDAEGGGEITAANQLTGAFQLRAGSADSALTLPIPAQAYTVEVRGVGGGTGVALAEIYDAGGGQASGELINISGRGFVGAGENILIGGFVVAGDAPVLVLVRAAGPALAPLGVSGTLARPRLRVFRGGLQLAGAAAWSAGDSPATIAEAAARVGAFRFVQGSDDAAMLLFLPPGSYTAQVSGADGGTGVALLEIYHVRDF